MRNLGYFGQTDPLPQLEQAISALEGAKRAANNWAGGTCHKNGAGVRCGDNSSSSDRDKCCVSEDNPPRARAAIRILNNLKTATTDNPVARAPIVTALNRLERFFGTPGAQFSNDSGYQSASWEAVSATIQQSLGDLYKAQSALGGGNTTLYIIIGVSIVAFIGLLYYLK
jgi:hypothetical protein